MEGVGSVTGWYINGGIAVFPVSVELGYASFKGTMKSETDPLRTIGGGTGRDIDINIHNFWFGTGLAIASTDKIGLIFPTFEADLMTMDFETRTNTSSGKGDVGIIVNAGIGLKILIAFSGGIGLMINPVYTFNLLDINFDALYDETNTAYDEFSDQPYGSFGGFQFRAGIMLYLTD